MPRNATSTKPPAIKAGVIARYAGGESKAQIARELGMDRETVTRILDEPGIKEAVEASRTRCLALLPKAERAVERQLDEGDGDLGLRFLEKSGVLAGDGATHFSFHDDSRLQIAMQTLLPPLSDAPSAAHLSGDSTDVDALALTAEAEVCAESSDVEAVAAPLASTQASRPSEPINIVTGKHDRWCRCRDCRPPGACD